MAVTENLLELFNQKVFRIPDYQRGYAWGEKQLSDLWDDIDEIGDDNGVLKNHYTGTLFLEEISTEEISDDEEWIASKFYNIVDGQQRLTTIVILLFELLKKTDKGYCERRKGELLELFIAKKNLAGTNAVYKFGYASTNKNNKYLLHSIFENEKVIEEPNSANLYTKNLKFAKDYFSKKIESLNDPQLELLFKKLVSALQFDIRTIEKDLDVQAVFETMNNRGKPLTILEKLKNRLIYLTERLPNTDKSLLRDKINDAWGKIYASLARDPDCVLDEDEFLSAHLSLYKKPDSNTFSEKAAEEKVFQMFCNKPEKYKEDAVSYQKIENYIVSLSELAPIWYEIHHSTNSVKKIFLLNGSKEVKILLVSLFLKTEKNRQELETSLELIERVFFRNGVPGMYLLDSYRESALRAREIYNGGKITELIEYLNEKLKTPINEKSVIDGFRYLFSLKTGNRGFHRWGDLKYFLFEYEEYIKKPESKETNDKVPLNDFAITTIEHIIPQTWQNFWGNEMDEFTQNIEDDKKDHARIVLLNTLGNLTILKNGKNSGLGNYPWDYKKSRFTTGSYSEIEISKHDYWDYHIIRDKGADKLKYLGQKVQNGFKFNENSIRQILFDSEYIIQKVYE